MIMMMKTSRHKRSGYTDMSQKPSWIFYIIAAILFVVSCVAAYQSR